MRGKWAREQHWGEGRRGNAEQSTKGKILVTEGGSVNWQLEHSQEVPLKLEQTPAFRPGTTVPLMRDNRGSLSATSCLGGKTKSHKTVLLLRAKCKSSSSTTTGSRGKHLRGNLSWRGNSLNLCLRECTEGRCVVYCQSQHRDLWRLSCAPGQKTLDNCQELLLPRYY